MIAHDRYRIDHLSGHGDHEPQAIACDGRRAWREYADHVAIGPTALPRDMINLFDPRWLLASRLSGGEQATVSGRTGFRLRHAHRAGTRRPGSPWPRSAAARRCSTRTWASCSAWPGTRPAAR